MKRFVVFAIMLLKWRLQGRNGPAMIPPLLLVDVAMLFTFSAS
jgi:hypothetical protein